VGLHGLVRGSALATVSTACFNCGKPPVVFYDFFAIEYYSRSVKKGKWISTETKEDIAGFLRLPLCGNCLQEALREHIAANTKKNGRPLFKKGKGVEFSRELLSQMQRGIYKDSVALRILFAHTLKRPFLIARSLGTAISEQLPLSGDRDSIGSATSLYDYAFIKPEYVLLAFNQQNEEFQQPFSQPLVRTIEGSSLFLHFIPRMSELILPTTLQWRVSPLEAMYHDRLEGH